MRDLKYVATSVGDIAFTESGAGPTALFVHGVFLNGYLWRQVIDRVGDLRRCIAVDLLAHGGTRTSPDQDISFNAQADMLEAVCNELSLDQVDLVANDSGGGIAQIFAARHPGRIRSMTLTNCDVHDNWPPKSLSPLTRAVADGRLGDIGRGLLADVNFARKFFGAGLEHPERISEETFRVYLLPLFSTSEAICHLERFFESLDCGQTVAVEPLLKQLQAPTLIVWGTNDMFFPLEWAYWLRDTIPGTREVVELHGAKLFFPEERPEELSRAIRKLWTS